MPKYKVILSPEQTDIIVASLRNATFPVDSDEEFEQALLIGMFRCAQFDVLNDFTA